MEKFCLYSVAFNFEEDFLKGGWLNVSRAFPGP